MKRPNTCVNLIKAINQVDKSGDPVRLARAMANVVVGQILPDGVVKGAYATIADATLVLPSVDAAVRWVNELVARINGALEPKG